MHGTFGLLVLICGPVFVALIVACVLLRFAEKDASWLSFLTCVAGVAIAIDVVAVMPYDVWHALSLGSDENNSSLLRWTWAGTYWTTVLLSYLLCPILMEYENSGDFTVAARLRFSLRRNAVFYGVSTFMMVVLLIILVARGEVKGSVQSWCIAASNAWGLFVLTVLMGFGLVAVPRHFWSLAKPSVLLQDFYRNAVVKDETRLTRLFELQDAVEQARLELCAMTPDAEETQGVAFATVSHMTDRCECLHMELSRSRVFQKGDTEGCLPLVPRPSIARFAEVHRTLKAAALEARRASCCFDSHIHRCIFFEDLEHGDYRAAVNMLGIRRTAMAGTLRSRLCTGMVKLCQVLLTFWLRHVRARFLLALGHASCIFSIIVVLGQLTLFANGWHLSLLSLFFLHDYGPWLTQVFCLVPLAYTTYTAYFSIFRLKISGWYGLYGNRHTDIGSLLWCASILARLAAPLCYHFLLLIRVKGTTFQAFMGQMNIVPVLGESFNQVFPCLIALLCCCNVFNVYSRFLQLFTLGIMEFEFGEESAGDDPVTDGKQLVDRERRRLAEEVDLEVEGRAAPFFASAAPAG